MAQRDTNPYKYSDSNKRYLTYDRYLKLRFGGKVAKVTFDIGTTCPNIDGTRGHGGCIYCSGGSRSAVGETLDEQYKNGVAVAERKWSPIGFIAYFQSNTNTYGDLEFIERQMNYSASLPRVLMLDISTRADCLGEKELSMLTRLAEKLPVTVELGLQSSSDKTADLINRCHSYSEFLRGYTRLKEVCDRVSDSCGISEVFSIPMKRMTVGVHIINGLPFETEDDMMKTALDLASLEPDMVKIHLMHVLRGTKLAEMYEKGEYTPLTRDEYVRITANQLEVLPRKTVIGRITGDGISSSLLAPEWSRRKTEVANEIDKELYRRGTYEGIHSPVKDVNKQK